MERLYCDRCGDPIDQNTNWGNCTECGDDLCENCVPYGFDNEGRCGTCHTKDRAIIQQLLQPDSTQ